jgi:uncharacterized protein (DUF1015 family)
MIKIHPFEAERPLHQLSEAVASVPYDVVSTDEARALALGNEHSFLHVVRPEIDLPADTGPYSDAVYAMARTNLDRLRDSGVIVKDLDPGIYLYRLTWQGRSQTGIVCCCDAQQYREGLVKKHEFTRPDKEDDRTRHLQATEAHAEPVFLAFHDDEAIAALIQGDLASTPYCTFEADDGVTHECWKVDDPQAYAKAFQGLDALYIADGHHRSAAAERTATTLMNANPEHTGDEPYNRLLAVCFPSSELRILPYNRVVQDLAGMSKTEFVERLATVGTLTPTTDPTPQGRGVVCVSLDGSWHELRFDPARIDHSDPVESLDCALLQSLVLNPMLGIDDPRTNSRIQFVGGIRTLEELADKAGSSGVAFSMHPTSMEELLSVADSGMTMPPKSTWFEPKLRSGLFVHDFSGSSS